MGRARASIVVPGRAAFAEQLWYDPSRWASWIDGFGHVVTLEDGWPEAGSRRLWDSPPRGRGRVSERVTRFEQRIGQVLEVEDAALSGTQSVTFEPGPDNVRITLALQYRLKQRNPLTPVIDLLITRRRIAESLRRTLARFSAELAAERQFGRPR